MTFLSVSGGVISNSDEPYKGNKMSDCNSTPHVHVDEQGLIVKCYHKCKNILTEPAFWLGVTITFPIEHFLWTKVPGFSHISEWLGLFTH